MRYPAYEEYSQTNDSLVSELPLTWVLRKIKRVVDTKITDGPHETPPLQDDGIPFISAEAVKNNHIDFSKKRGFITEELHKQYCKKVRPQRNDLFIIKSGATTGNIAKVETDIEFSIWSPLALIRTNIKAFSGYTYYYLQSPYFRMQVELNWSYGTQENIGMGVLENLKMPIPTLEEQKQIAAFLDRETAVIDTLIAKQEALINLLAEKRTAVISHAVTKGLNPHAPLKDSDTEWLGQIPAHWEASKPKYFTNRIVDGVHHTPNYVDEGIPFITVKNLTATQRGISFQDTKFISQETHKKLLLRANPQQGDILITKDGTLGVTRVIDTDREFSIFVSVALIKPIAIKIESHFLRYVLESEVAVDQFEARKLGSGLKHLHLGEIADISIALPPLQEQKIIVDYIESQIEKLDKLVRNVEQAISLLKERRTALISAAVTGKIDVRHT